ncbi:MAG: DUF438 domain-containing protein [Candidatus Aminicenantes bacterium]|nr:DUF438 domain-containing protein [Candidatus Aminicenantes bacterium]
MGEQDSSLKSEKQAALKGIIRDLHAGVPVEKLRKTFARLIKDTSPEEIADMENSLIQEGFPVEEVQRLCDVHAQVFDKALKKAGKPGRIPGHPIHTFVQENKAAKSILKELKRAGKPLGKGDPGPGEIERFRETLARLREVEKHYARKENQLFPALETKHFLGPSKVMWGKHDEVRALFRKAAGELEAKDWAGAAATAKTISGAVKKLIFLEEKILYPTSARKLTTVDWARIKRGEHEIGYAWVKPSNLWDAQLADAAAKAEPEPPASAPTATPSAPIPSAPSDGTVELARGHLTPEQIDLLLKKIPVDITFVDENGRVRYYSDTEDRIFPRSPEVIGRQVQNCHPPKSLAVVNAIVQAFKDKTKDKAEFWIQKGGRFILIRYFALYDRGGNYRGVLEVSQDATEIRALQGERRLLDW